ncbi:hypothetical protein KXJ72_14525 [Comamonas aquatica]|nr:hypothetical protein KXJ72_14525 [Comamonas aquatica]
MDEKAHGFGCGPFLIYRYFLALALIWYALVAMFFVVLLGLAFAVCLFAEAAYRAAATRFLLSCQKKSGKEKARLAGGLSGGTHCAPASLRSNSRRKYEGHPPSGARRLRARGL